MVQPAALPFLGHFTALQDPWQTDKVLYPLPELLLLLLCGTVAGADDFVELALWGWRAPAVPASFPAVRARYSEP